MNEDVLASEVFGCLQRAMATDPRGLADLCRDYLAEARQTLKSLQQSLTDSDLETLRSQAHFLKGGSQVIGTKAVAQCCTALEEAVRCRDLANAQEILTRMAAAIDTAKTEIGLRIGVPMNSADESAP